MDVEIITEYAKKCVWSERQSTLNDQLYITAKQNHELHVLNNVVEYVITDSPIILGMLYKSDSTAEGFDQMLLNLFNSYNNINVFINRTKIYNPKGRMQSESESNEIAKTLKQLLKQNNIPFIEIDGDEECVDKIYDQLLMEANNVNVDQSEDYDKHRIDLCKPFKSEF